MRSIVILFTLVILISNKPLAQCFQDRHNANPGSSWLSCAPSENPNSLHGIGHWIMYDLGDVYAMDEVVLWNYNNIQDLNNGIQNFSIDLSIDGVVWSEQGSYTADLASGSSFYEGELVGDLANVSTRYLLLTALDNYGGSCYGFSELKITIADAAVPLDLLAFDVKKEKSNALLTWKTENELALEAYIIERSVNENTWDKIGSVISKNAANEQLYKYTDRSVFNLFTQPYIYYRLAITHLDGSIEYSEIRSLRNDDNLNFKVYPNPTSDIINVSLGQYLEDDIFISISDIDGKLVQSETYKVNNGAFSIPIGEHLSNKDYYLSIFKDNMLIHQELFSVFR